MGCCQSANRDKDKLLPDLEIHGLKANLSEEDSSIIVSWKPVRGISADVFTQIFKNGLELEERECIGNFFEYKSTEPSSSYQFKVWIENEDFNTKPSLSNIVYTRPDKLKNLKATVYGDQINVTWDTPERQFEKYKIEVFMYKKLILLKRLNRNAFCVRHCKLSKPYRIEVKVKDKNGIYSKPVETEVALPPPPVRYLKIRAVGSGFKVEWKQSKAINSCDVKVYRENKLKCECNNITCQEFTLRQCRPSSRYTVKVSPKNLFNLVGSAAEGTFYSDISPIKELRTEEENGQIHLRWNKPEENNLEYKVKLSKQGFFRRVYLQTFTVFNKNEVSFSVPEAREGKKYDFEIKVKNSYGIEGRTRKVSHIFSGLVKIRMHILVKADHDITVIYGSEENSLKADVEEWKENGYKSAHPKPMSVVLHSTKKYKNNIRCKENTVQIFPAEGHEMEQQCMLGAQAVSLNYCVEARHSGKYTLEFKLEEHGQASRTLRTDPFIINTGAQLQPTTVNHIGHLHAALCNLGENGGRVTLNNGANINVNPDQVQNHLSVKAGHVSAHVVPRALKGESSGSSNAAFE
uniref:uncharacterized protein LOC120348508 n=1 Tax=Styela clava TaxID=7725 RepID=UPI00193A774F|nr:uncharacterized protein LOC120348508 [Styela clava]